VRPHQPVRLLLYLTRVSWVLVAGSGPPSISGGNSVSVDPELIKILACPSCKTPVALVHNDTALKCGECHRVYPIKDDIPVMLIDEATIEQ
jgi:uncharacterized protein YbaR (Trm112 family)